MYIRRGADDLPLEKIVLIMKQKQTVATLNTNKYTHTTVQSAYSKMARSLLVVRSMHSSTVMSEIEIASSRMHLTNQAAQCSQLDRPMIFIVSLSWRSFSTVMYLTVLMAE